MDILKDLLIVVIAILVFLYGIVGEIIRLLKEKKLEKMKNGG